MTPLTHLQKSVLITFWILPTNLEEASSWIERWYYALLREAMRRWYGLMKTFARGVFGTGMYLPAIARGQLQENKQEIRWWFSTFLVKTHKVQTGRPIPDNSYSEANHPLWDTKLNSWGELAKEVDDDYLVKMRMLKLVLILNMLEWPLENVCITLNYRKSYV